MVSESSSAGVAKEDPSSEAHLVDEADVGGSVMI